MFWLLEVRLTLWLLCFFSFSLSSRRPVFLFSVNGNPGFKDVPPIRTTAESSASANSDTSLKAVWVIRWGRPSRFLNLIQNFLFHLICIFSCYLTTPFIFESESRAYTRVKILLVFSFSTMLTAYVLSLNLGALSFSSTTCMTNLH